MLALTDEIEERILFEGPDTVAAVFLEPVQNAGGCFVPPAGLLRAGARDLRPPRRAARVRRGDLRVRPARHDVRLRALRLPARHHHLRQGPHQRLLAARRGDLPRLPRRAVPRGHGVVRARPHVRRPSRSAARSASPTSTCSSRRRCSTTSLRPRGRLPRAPRAACATCPSSATSAARATSRPSSWSPTRRRDAQFTAEQREELLRGFLLPRFYEAGLICRTDDRGDPVVQLAPPLVAGDAELDEIADVLRAVLTEASDRFCV